MQDTGRIARPITPTARRVVFGGQLAPDTLDELRLASDVDRAHLVMLTEVGVVAPGRAANLLRAIHELRATDFAPLLGRPATRGTYLAYEDWLIERCGMSSGGMLALGRSRNDLAATVSRLQLRLPYGRLSGAILRLLAALVGRSRRFNAVVMPAYTHYQPAVPTTYGHYLAGVALAVGRDLAGIEVAGEELDSCPLGAGAGGGTTVPIDPGRTAALLGFSRPVTHSGDAVASRDLALRLLAAASVLGVTMTRAANDLLAWTTAEFGFLRLPDELVGSSSMMPQKRNPFLLEHVAGRSATALGAFVSSSAAMRAAPFSNSVAAGTEACAPVAAALDAASEAAVLLRLVLAGARPDPEAMLARASAAHTGATALAEALALGSGIPFREAHRGVGRLVNQAEAEGLDLRQAALRSEDLVLREALRAGDNGGSVLRACEPVAVVRTARYGAGPGGPHPAPGLREAALAWAASVSRRRLRRRRWALAASCLDDATARLLGTGAGTP